ncbi:response regulator [Rhodovulum tesquicola]|uniref:response regulator n=1 Tax=Rhodovulum TaxID=34008 RepID=UPI0017C5897A|nr:MULTISPECIES: response regulator [Rhodovulum]MCO8145581.1 response regulator [Rhodovulum tesquicola]HDR29896.1 response regulator [Rhodovulum sp.]
MSLKDSLRVMVVDDMAVSRGLVTQSLEEIGIFQISAENNGKSALNRLVADPVHLVLADHNMPGMDGLQLLEGLRRNRSTHRIGYILVTGTPTPELIQKGQQLGLNNLVKKPFTTATMKKAIEAVVGRL